MKARKFLCIFLTLAMLLPTLLMGLVLDMAAENSVSNATEAYVSEGLVSFYSGMSNTESGYDENATAWYDLTGDNDLPVTASNHSYFTPRGLYIKGVEHFFPQPIVDLVNGNAFTVEINFDEFISIGGSFNTFMNSKNDNFALFRRNSNNVLEFKFAANPGNERPTVADGLNIINYSTISITYEVGGKCRIYVDGELMAEVACPKAMGANNLFIGHAEDSKKFETVYRAIRFYDRALTAEEISQNAKADAALYGGEANQNTPTYISVAQPRTNIVGDIAVTREINSKEELGTMMAEEKLPSSAIYTINDKAEVVDANGQAFATLSEMLELTEYKILPILIPTSDASVDALAAFTKESKFTDLMVLSKNFDIVNSARNKMPTVRGAIDLEDMLDGVPSLTQSKCLEIRRIVKSHAASVAVLPVRFAKQDMVQYLYDNQVNVWVKTDDQLTDIDAYTALLSGAVGVISDDTATLLELACALPENTMTRMPLNVGHRGIPSKAPENTIEGAWYAYEHGATCIELDVYLTTDGEVVVMHDGTTGRTCDKDLPVEGSTWAQLSELYVNKGFENHERFSDCRIPRLEEYLSLFGSLDLHLFIEIKSNKTEIVEKISALIAQYDVYGQCSVITFNTGIMEAMRRLYPEMSVGALCSGYMSETNPDHDMKAVMEFIGSYNATLNPSYAGYGEKAVRAALIRGIGVFPWTFRGDAGVYEDHFVWGYTALTGDNADVLKRYVKKVEYIHTQKIKGGAERELQLNVFHYSNPDQLIDADITLLSGEDVLSVDGSKIIAGKYSGKAVLMLSHTYRLGDEKVTVYTQPMTFTVEGLDPPDPSDTQPTETPVATEPATSPETDTTPDVSTSQVGNEDTSELTSDPEPAVENGCASMVSGASIVMLVTVLLGSAWRVSKKENQQQI